MIFWEYSWEQLDFLGIFLGALATLGAALWKSFLLGREGLGWEFGFLTHVPHSEQNSQPCLAGVL